MAVRAFQAEYVDAVDAAETVLLPQLDQRLAAADHVRDACALAVQAPYRPLYHRPDAARLRSEEHTSELQSLMRISYDVLCLKTKKKNIHTHKTIDHKMTQNHTTKHIPS